VGVGLGETYLDWELTNKKSVLTCLLLLNWVWAKAKCNKGS